MDGAESAKLSLISGFNHHANVDFRDQPDLKLGFKLISCGLFGFMMRFIR
jgi:hypothetical protein